MKAKSVSIVIPTHNRVDLLKRAIRSVLNQSYTNMEILVINDGSVDKTKDYLAELSATDTRFVIINHDQAQGACVARNSGIAKAQGEYITFLDDDDEWTKDRLSTLVSNFDPERYSFICSAYWMITNKGKIPYCTEEKDISLIDVLWGNIVGNSVLTLTSRARAVNGFDPAFTSAQDYDFFTRLIKSFGTAKRINTSTLLQHTEHEQPRISTAGNKRLLGLLLFYKRHAQDMTSSQKAFYKYMYRRLYKNERRLALLIKAIPGLPIQMLKKEILHLAKKMLLR